jgi:hypothetical protein
MPFIANFQQNFNTLTRVNFYSFSTIFIDVGRYVSRFCWTKKLALPALALREIT